MEAFTLVCGLVIWYFAVVGMMTVYKRYAASRLTVADPSAGRGRLARVAAAALGGEADVASVVGGGPPHGQPSA